MGPIILFDKSALQALSIDESVWLDFFFVSVICPMFFVETLADLEKAIQSGRSPEEEVGLIAEKTPEVDAYPTVLHAPLCVKNLLGYAVPMDRRPLITGGQPVRARERTGIKYDLPQEVEALSRWQQGHFLKVEREFAAVWRSMLAAMSFDAAIDLLSRKGIVLGGCKSLGEVRSLAEYVVAEQALSIDVARLSLRLLGVSPQHAKPVLQRLEALDHPPLAVFAPFAAHVLRVEIFFYAAVASNLIGKERASNKVDCAYLYYLPFCQIFTSGDKLHRRCAPFFLTEDQQFVWASDLKQGLAEIDGHFDKLPAAEKARGLYAIARHPPKEERFLVSELWDRYLPGWRSRVDTGVEKERDVEADYVRELREFTDAEPLGPSQVDFDPTKPELVAFKRKVKRRKGKWWQVPKDLKDQDECSQ